MTWVLVALWVTMGCIAVAMVIGIIDEMRRVPSNIRRTGLGIAFVVSFASLWLLVTPLTLPAGGECGAPLSVLTEYGSPPVIHSVACAEQMRLYAAVGLIAALTTPMLVLSTRSRKD
jgi:hypothetical protein